MLLSHNPATVMSGLVLYVDAKNVKSYSGVGTTWHDLSGRGNTGTMTNVTYNAGEMSFNGSNSKVDCGNGATLQITSGSVGAWFKADNGNSGYNGIVVKQYAWGLFVLNNYLEVYDWGNNLTRPTNVFVGNNLWNHVMMTFTETTGTPSNNALVYLNGSLVATVTVKHNNHNVNFQIGEGNVPPTQAFGGVIPTAYVYNRVLSASEVLQNFNALRGRYGI